MVIYEPVLIKYTEEQLKCRSDFIQKYANNKEFRKLINRISQDAKNETNKTFRRRNDKKNKRQEKCFLQKIRKILKSFSDCVERIFAQK